MRAYLAKNDGAVAGAAHTPEDVRLLAEVDALHGNLSGPATHKLCERAWEVFGDARYERLAGISNGHPYNLRGPQTYQRCRGRVDKTRAVQIRIGERRRPRPEGRPDWLAPHADIGLLSKAWWSKDIPAPGAERK